MKLNNVRIIHNKCSLCGVIITDPIEQEKHIRIENHIQKNMKGDCGSVGLELLKSVSELEERCSVIKQAVREKYFTLEEALIIYKVSMEDYEKQK